MDQQPSPTNMQPEQQPAMQPQKPCCKAWPMAAIVAAGVLVIGGLAYGSYYIFKPQYTCWPYCPGMTDQDRENIKNAAEKASQNASPSPSASVSTSPSPSASADPTADWQTYKNEQYGFEVKYPNQFYIVSKETSSVSLDDIKFRDQDKFRRYTKIAVTESSSLDDFLSRLIDDVTGEKLNVIKKEKLSDSPLIYKLYFSNSDEVQGLVIKNNNYVHIVSGSGPAVDQILSTFKFTK